MIRPTSDFHYKKAILKEQKQTYKYMITVEQCLFFGEWLADRYIRLGRCWTPKDPKDSSTWTTAELWELYQKTYLGKKG